MLGHDQRKRVAAVAEPDAGPLFLDALGTFGVAPARDAMPRPLRTMQLEQALTISTLTGGFLYKIAPLLKAAADCSNSLPSLEIYDPS